MKPRPEDGGLDEITPGLNSELNLIIFQNPEEIDEPDGTTYELATLDRTREGVEWHGDGILDKLMPGLPKVKTLEVSKPEITTKTNSLSRNHIRRKFCQRPARRNHHFTKERRPRPPQKRFCSDRSENPSSFNNIEPWVCKPWENQTFSNTTPSASATSLISTDNYYAPTSASSLPFPPSTSTSIFNVPNSSTYEKNIRPTTTSNNSFINNHLGHLNRPPPPINRIPFGPPPRYPLPNRCSQYLDRGFSGHDPASNLDFNGPSHKTGLLGEKPTARYQGNYGLLGDSPFPNMPFNRNTAMYPNGASTHCNLEENAVTFLPTDEENIGDKNSSSLGSYDTDYCRVPRSDFNLFKDGNEISRQESRDSYEYPNNSDFRNNSFRDASKTNYGRFQNSSNSVNHYEDQHKNSYNRNRPKDNKSISLKSSRDSQKTNNYRFKKPSARVRHSKINYKKVGDNDSQISSTAKTSPFMNNQDRNLNEDPLIHISDSAVVYNTEDFQNNAYPADATNSSTSRSIFRQNIHSKNTRGTKKPWSTNKFRNNFYKTNRGKYNQGHQRFRNWSTPQK